MLSALTLVAAESAETAEHGGWNPYLVGAIALGILLALMVALLSFAGGREHS